MSVKCQDCKWHSRESDTCDYYLYNFVRRGCPPGENCTRYKPGKHRSGALPNSLPLKHRSEKIRNREEQCMELYKQGLNDHEIATEVGCSAKTIGKWRRNLGLPTQREVKRYYTV